MSSAPVVRVSVRQPDGGEAVLPLSRIDSVAQLRAMIQWCVDNDEWNYHAIPRAVKQRSAPAPPGDDVKADDEMWTLNEQVEGGQLDDDPDAPEDLEAAHRHANRSNGDVIEAEPGRIEIMHGPVVLQDGYLLSEYGVEDGSFLHPLYTLRGGGGNQTRSWGFALAQLPWSDREWYRAGTSSALASVSAWWAGASDNVAAATAGMRASEGHSLPSRATLQSAAGEQLPGVFGAGVLGDSDDNAAL